MARNLPLKIPGQWHDLITASDSESIGSQGIQDDGEDGSPPAPELALISELLENIERSPLSQEAHVLLMQHYAMCGWHDAAEEEAHRDLKIKPTAKEAQKYLEDLRKAKLRGSDEAGNRKGKGKANQSNKDIDSKEMPGQSTNSRQQSAQAPTWRPSLFPITSKEASLQELEDRYVALLEGARLCLSETKLLKDLKIPNCEYQISDLEALAKGQVNSVVRTKPLEGVKVVAEAIVADNKNGGQKTD